MSTMMAILSHGLAFLAGAAAVWLIGVVTGLVAVIFADGDEAEFNEHDPYGY
ncbi:hypothetical protein [Brevundimonas diminuta]|uniref:hypothetical protein n=1 Tax=Brevundimonas diminuta TaxID=293 RepID=UPI0030F5F848